MGIKLGRMFYEKDDVVAIARNLLGKELHTYIGGAHTSGMITETEAYSGVGDRACHGRVCTPRTKVMFGPGGHAYVHMCYGIHTMFNVVTNREGISAGVLIRAIHPLIGKEIMLQRSGKDKNSSYKFNGPGKITKALGMTMEHYGRDLTGDVIRLEDSNVILTEDDIVVGPRVGIDYAGEDALHPRRFRIKKFI